MEKEQRNAIQRAVKDARILLEADFGSQLLEVFDIDVAKARVADGPGSHLDGEQRFLRSKLTAAIAHKQAAGNDLKEALLLFRREMAFTALNRFVALKLMEARDLVHECVSQGLQSSGFEEFTGLAPALLADPEGSYQLFLQCLFEDVSREVKVLFDPRDPASLLWPRRATLLELLEILNRPELAELWSEDETIGWVYQYFNGNDVKDMRDAVKGGAPRNSRELAVRNQFFTPRYVVEFLTDNTLGRTWYEMRRGETCLRDCCRFLVRRPTEIFLQSGEAAPENATVHGGETAGETLSQEELLRQPVHIPHRPLKDPREILLLDPACGSMHFGLYAFDLFTVIYEEAWDIAHGSDGAAKTTATFAPFVAFANSFADKAAFLREMPRLIVEHNIHGIDIDPRATQIARLSLWLRTQRAWQQIGVAIADRPSIRRANVVCAEPMPGEKELLREFVAKEFSPGEQPAFSHLLETIFEKMALAGEAGSLLRIEEDIRTAIADAKRLWKQGPRYQQASLFSAAGATADQAELGLDLSGITDKQFWEQSEQRIYDALQRYAEQAENGGGFKRRLFADDSAQGFAFIDLCRKRYDAVVMNPPFGLSCSKAESHLQDTYPNGWVDLYACFVWRAIEFAKMGWLGAITSRSFISSKKLEKLRASQLIPKLHVFADLGKGVMDAANVEACAYTLGSSSLGSRIWAANLVRCSDREQQLANIVGALCSPELHAPLREALLGLPNSRLLYSVPPRITDMLRSSTRFEPSIGTVRCGLTTFDDVRFIRSSWEVSPIEIGIGRQWEPFEKGGEYVNYHGDIHLVIKRLHGGEEMAAVNQLINGQTAQSRQASTYYYRPGSYYTDRSQRGFAARALPAGCVIAGNAPAILSESHISSLYILGWVNSRLIRSLVEMQAVDKKFYPGFVKSLPWSPPSQALTSVVESCTSEILTLHGKYGIHEETSPDFVQPWRVDGIETIQAAVRRLADNWAEERTRTMTLQRQVSDQIDDLYAVTGAREFAESILERDVTSEVTFEPPDAIEFASTFLSYQIGLAYGRWDIRYSSGIWQVPRPPDPFALLPSCPPGVLKGDDEMPLLPGEGLRLRGEGLYPLDVAWDGILVDDPEHPLDIERRVQAALSVIWGDQAEELSQEACTLLGVPNLREWFRRPAGFFADHLKRYSKSRRQAPIYWPLSAGNCSYSVWLYYHRFTADTLYRVLQDYVDPRISQAERDCFEWQQQVASGGTTDAAQQLQSSQALLEDLKQLKAELSLVAPLWKPDLNDGVIINHAILWRITPHAPWQKKVKECWDKLVDEEYDWAHLAFHLWPERVIPKCATDRSLAIAHGLDDTFWRENRQGKWEPIPLSEEQLAQVVAAHTNHARSDALKRFLAAPPPLAATRARAPRAAQPASAGTSRARRTSQTLDPELIRQVQLVLTAAPPEGLAKAAIAELHATEDVLLTAVIKQLKESGQIEQLGQKRGARYRLSPAGLAAVETEGGMD